MALASTRLNPPYLYWQASINVILGDSCLLNSACCENCVHLVRQAMGGQYLFSIVEKCTSRTMAMHNFGTPSSGI